MKAWSSKGISTIVSCLGKLLIVDEMTPKMCAEGEGRLGFARVLVEIGVKKELKEQIRMVYKQKNRSCNVTKFVKVKYAWRPNTCSLYFVFSHDTSRCSHKNDNVKKPSGSNVHMGNKEFREVRYASSRKQSFKNKQSNGDGKKLPVSGNNDRRNMNGYDKNNNSEAMGRGNEKDKGKFEFRRKQNSKSMRNRNGKENTGSGFK
ncbi:ATPase, F1/V1/A1 complex, alpha/beta subunit [Tanacetum coccineum]